ncbi:carbonic anhydrase [Solwaraspora sp. WMMD406]|uniref:carbonic anhydrase n=1 Tax=Solwaraspora sp. WMMD406 TaxID=3016095 RepID=UPI002415F72F|nr:carbonic anhydrase [Solwaraspora sp. WMMD406]MDG4763698.1 carbonic anhydrase [Solwaraspora sp. WMMD406]
MPLIAAASRRTKRGVRSWSRVRPNGEDQSPRQSGSCWSRVSLTSVSRSDLAAGRAYGQPGPGGVGPSAGRICVVRSAGHVLDWAMLASVEFAVTELKVPLVVVLGHEDCRAIAATIEAVRGKRRPTGLRGVLVDQIAPAVTDAEALDAGRASTGPASTGPASADLDRVTRAHVRRTVDRLKQTGGVAELFAAHRVDVVGAVYRLDSGHVELP